MKYIFVPKRFSAKSQELIIKCDTILEEYRAQGYRLSLRQLYYQLVARDIIPNNLKSYNNVGVLISDARNAGWIDWDMIEDRGREAQYNSHWHSPADILDSAAYGFRIDHWAGQKNYVEVMVEKDALSGILWPVCQKWDVHFTANKGYSSSSAMYEAGERLRHQLRTNNIEKAHIIYLGDHDPSGIDMTRDIEDRLGLYAREEIEIVIHRLALNFDQVQMWNPPENPAKVTDSRFASYEAKFGSSSWELDAVEPATLAQLVSEQIVILINQNQWERVSNKQADMINDLKEMAAQYREEHGDE